MAQIQEVTPDAADNSGTIFDAEPLQKVQNNDDNYNVFAIESEHLEQPESDDNDDLAKERDLLAFLIEKLKCEIDDSKNRNKIFETSNKALVDKLKGEIKDFKTKNKSLESSNNHFKEANNELSKTNQLMFKDLKKFQAELDRYHDVIALENKVKVLDDIVYKTGQSVQTMNMLNRNCKMSFVKPEFLKKAQRANPRLYDIGFYNDNLALMLAPEYDEMIHLAQESRSKLSYLIRPFDYEKLNNLYDLFVPQREKSPEQRYFSKRSKMSHTPVKNENSKESFNKQTTSLEKRMDKSIPEYYYTDHMNAILGVYTTLDEFTDLQCDYVDQVVKCEHLEKELSKINTTSKSFEALQKHAINLELALQQCKEQIKNDKAFKENQSNVFLKEREQYFEIQDLKTQLQDKGIAISELKKLIEKMKGKSVETKFEKSLVIQQPNAFKSQRQSVLGVIPTTSVSRPQLKSNQLEDRTLNVNFVCVTCGKCMLNDNHDMCVFHYINGVNSRTKMAIVVPISTREHKRTVNQSVATPFRRTVVSESTNQKSRSTIRKLYEHVSKTCSWWYPKFTPSRYKWKPKSLIVNVNTNVSMPLGNESRTANILEPMTPRYVVPAGKVIIIVSTGRVSLVPTGSVLSLGRVK
ncbi:hypothetical protein Tco_0653685 [Tanacetum coccineum]|uniref:Uncharacterized protein n=1 Tax=Tanacetum coccineum TaxID=301880 RepID=A0ABQ4X142_9ASTR